MSLVLLEEACYEGMLAPKHGGDAALSVEAQPLFQRRLGTALRVEQ
jgi:hypothetical protein